jgi:hypothetical protein
MSKAASRRSAGRILAMPALMALVSGAALAGALIGDGIWDLFLSIWLALPAMLLFACLAGSRWRRTG